MAEAVRRRGGDIELLNQVVSLDRTRLDYIHKRDEARHRVNDLSEKVRQLHQANKAEEADVIKEESRALGQEAKQFGEQVDHMDEEIRSLMLLVPNIPADDCPDGLSEIENVVLRTHPEDFTADTSSTPVAYFQEHQQHPHWEFAVEMGILDVERAVKISGAMFAMFRGAGAALARALLAFGLDRNSDLYEEIIPPSIVREETMIKTGHLPKFVDDAYEIARDELWPIPTAEVPLTSLGADEIMAEEQLPMRFMSATPCYRREAGSAGRDTRGLLRVHEFQKVEILAYATPQQVEEIHAELLERAESAVRDLGLVYRIVDICAGDLGNSSKRTFDVEVYAPGARQWLECSSVSWFGDYQARRANIRYRATEGNLSEGKQLEGSRSDGKQLDGKQSGKHTAGKHTDFVHTLNGSAVAVPRLWAAITETYRQPDGSIAVPEVLVPYMGGLKVITGPKMTAGPKMTG